MAKKKTTYRRIKGVLYKKTSTKGYNAFSAFTWLKVNKKKK